MLDDAPPPTERHDAPSSAEDVERTPLERTPLFRDVPTSRGAPVRAPEVADEHAGTTETAPEARMEPPTAGSAAGTPEPPRSGLSLDALGVGTNPFLGMKGFGAVDPAPAAPTPPEAPDRTRVAEQRLKQYLVGGMLAHDRATGASRNGAVVTALQEAAMLVASPVNGQAEFVATIDATGLVTALRPTRASSNAMDWRNVAARALKALAKKRLRVPAGAAGLEVRLALTSKVQLPSGSDSLATIHSVPLLSEDGTRLSRLELPKESNKLPDPNSPEVVGTPMMKQPIPGGGLDGDLADIGAVGRRIVHVTITDERPL